MKKHKKSFIIILVCAIIMFILFFPYFKAEFLTLKYGNEFNDLQKQTNMLTDADYHKVISYSKDTAKVFYVSGSGDLMIFKKDSNGNWKLSNWETVWSDSGSASGFMWPYYH